MNHNDFARRCSLPFLALLILALVPSLEAAQRGGPPPSPRSIAPIDLTGYWVSVVTEDWRFRMVTPRQGDYGGVPLNGAARQLADAWDPARDQAEGEACRSYGAAAIMRVPGRLNITWEDDQTLRIDTDAGMQTRLFHFGAGEPTDEPTWQGYSVAEWEIAPGGDAAERTGNLKVTTTGMRMGYLRKNGVPYSADAVLTEYFDRHVAPNGDVWLVVTAVVEDPQFLTTPFVTSSHFKQETDGSKWSPAPCAAE